MFVVLVGCIKILTTAALTENGRARRGFDLFACGSKSERHLRKKINPAVTHSAVADPANSRHLKKSLEARHLPGEQLLATVLEKPGLMQQLSKIFLCYKL